MRKNKTTKAIHYLAEYARWYKKMKFINVYLGYDFIDGKFKTWLCTSDSDKPRLIDICQSI